eukprot:4919816-Amphidinium_carterae.1
MTERRAKCLPCALAVTSNHIPQQSTTDQTYETDSWKISLHLGWPCVLDPSNACASHGKDQRVSSGFSLGVKKRTKATVSATLSSQWYSQSLKNSGNEVRTGQKWLLDAACEHDHADHPTFICHDVRPKLEVLRRQRVPCLTPPQQKQRRTITILRCTS